MTSVKPFGEVVHDPSRSQRLLTPNGPAQKSDFTDFKPVTVEEVQDTLAKYDIRKATGSDSIPASFLSTCSSELAEPVANIINASLSSSKMPSKLKVAAICPVFKAGDPSIPKNYRPASLLPIVSKVIESYVAQQLSIMWKFDLS